MGFRACRRSRLARAATSAGCASLGNTGGGNGCGRCAGSIVIRRLAARPTATGRHLQDANGGHPIPDADGRHLLALNAAAHLGDIFHGENRDLVLLTDDCQGRLWGNPGLEHERRGHRPGLAIGFVRHHTTAIPPLGRIVV